MRLIQIVPNLPPYVGGVADYAWILAGKLRSEFNIETVFIVCDPAWRGNTNQEGLFNTHVLPERTSSAIEHLFQKEDLHGLPVLLHFVGYGYDRYGCPGWLTEGLSSVRKEHLSSTFITIFHELYATGPIWTRTFWYSNRQKQIALNVALISDHCLMTTEIAANHLRRLLGNGSKIISIHPVFSTVGEIENPIPLSQRNRKLVVFGSGNWRRQIYQYYGNDLTHVCNQLHIEKIVDIGPSTVIPNHLLSRIDVKGLLSSEAVSTEMAQAYAGFFAYPIPFLGKSTIFAAYCAHGMLPLTHRGNDAHSKEGIVEGTHYQMSSTLSPSELIQQNVANNACGYYQKHSLLKQALLLVGLLYPVHIFKLFKQF